VGRRAVRGRGQSGRLHWCGRLAREGLRRFSCTTSCARRRPAASTASRLRARRQPAHARPAQQIHRCRDARVRDGVVSLVFRARGVRAAAP
jgi:hypothetical protein